ncbi:winged helix-turn-helix transcriptional regulator [Candidatus Nitrosocosmicus agrestis]|uniref:winged helix-turn-helix transcriptional regulator n=1 Tax=Candidatus Nitrosocosmicus agrestis TaxID=2563600 RepID=UPI00122E93BB|nr:winged helix-turn-helix transcriptional regulator [Candidatus Nitrosocosmicus sp. SS]KAA2282760.1 winged helix-turn-helix transcriptional regulator [Candidatus Nitrosocosmicus sp. SS]KAF0870307.1 winged helix-turn-helix transcriptional regulator [Candidatus Nitrosocosmicus sp. SS]
MYNKYTLQEIQRKVIEILQNNNPMSSSEIAKELGINRITMSKYLDILYFQKIINNKKIGSVNFWYLDPGITNIDSKDENYLEIQQNLIAALLGGQKEVCDNIMLSLTNRTSNLKRIFTDICIPTLNTISELYDRGKIGKSEKIHLIRNLSNAIRILGNNTKLPNIRHENSQVVIISGDNDSNPICDMLEILTTRLGAKSTFIGNVENSIDPFFDIDLHRYIIKLTKRVRGKTIVIVVSNNETSIRFIHSALLESEMKEKKIQLLIFSSKSLKEKLDRHIPDSNLHGDFESLIAVIETSIK